MRAARKIKRRINRKIEDYYGLLNLPYIVFYGIVSPLLDRAAHPVDTARWLKAEYDRWVDAED